MGDVVKEVGNDVPETFLRFDIFLAAYLAVMARYHCIAVEAVFFFSLVKMRQGWLLFILLK